MRPSSMVLSVCAGLALCLTAVPVEAQLQEVSEKRFEFTPFAGYAWGGSFQTDAGGAFPAGEIHLPGSFSYGGIISFLAHMGSAVELLYSRQDTDVEFDPVSGATTTLPGGFAMNYIQVGGRQEFGHSEKLRPFVTGSLGIGILDPKAEELGSSTRFSWSVGGGAKYMFASQKVGIRTDIKLWVTPVPSGDYGVWCGFYSCVATEGTAWVTQGQWTGGLVFAF
jgi:opacity protein-like surface antigen